MKAFLVAAISTVYFSWVSHAQNIDSVSKIIIEYGHGHNSWEPGVYGVSEIFEFNRIDSGYFENSKSIFIKRILEKDRHSYVRDTTRLPLKRHYLEAKTVRNLLIQLNTNKNNFTKSFLLPLLKRPSKKQVIHIAEKNDYRGVLFDKNTDKEDRDTIFRRLQRFYLGDSFLTELRPDSTNEMVVIDSYHGCRVYVMHSSDTTRYNLMFSNAFNVLFGQPVERVENHDFMHIKHIVNLEVNETLEKFLPAKCLLRHDLAYYSIVEEYVIWFLKNRLYR